MDDSGREGIGEREYLPRCCGAMYWRLVCLSGGGVLSRFGSDCDLLWRLAGTLHSYEDRRPPTASCDWDVL